VWSVAIATKKVWDVWNAPFFVFQSLSYFFPIMHA